MPTLQYHVLWPGGNTTALVQDIYPRAEHAGLSKAIMTHDTQIEQVGFIEPAKNPAAAFRLSMMGDEFCGNASRSAAYLWNRQTGARSFALEVPMTTELIACTVSDAETGITLPGDFVQAVHDVPEGRKVDLPGIAHIIVMECPTPTREEAERRLAPYLEETAIGCIFVTKKEDGWHIEPYVWVKDTQTLIHESACGSGTIAVAVALDSDHKTPVSVVQPSGERFTVVTHEDGGIELRGPVSVLADRSIEA